MIINVVVFYYELLGIVCCCCVVVGVMLVIGVVMLGFLLRWMFGELSFYWLMFVLVVVWIVGVLMFGLLYLGGICWCGCN